MPVDIDGILNRFWNDAQGRRYLRDWQHAEEVFTPGGFANAPKVKFMFHTNFIINGEAWQPPTGKNYGLLVKDVQLPKFKIDTAELNQYNRKRIVQTKIKYDPITITFHDDNMSQMTALWDAYYRYHYADSWNPTVTPFQSQPAAKAFNRRNIYDPSITGDMEYGLRGGSNNLETNDLYPNRGSKVPFFKNINIFGFWAGNYIAYTLINPIITKFDHDTYAYNEGGGTMQNTMTLEYETVTYNTGTMDPEVGLDEIVEGFGNDANYDIEDSPLLEGSLNPLDLAFNKLPEIIGGDIDNPLDLINKIGQIKEILNNEQGIVNSAKKQLQELLEDALVKILAGEDPFGDGGTGTPTANSSPTMVGFSSAAEFSGEEPPAGTQN